MDENHPKRRKDKYNPYTIGTTDDGRHWLTFSDGQGIRHHFEISNVVFDALNAFELGDLSYRAVFNSSLVMLCFLLLA